MRDSQDVSGNGIGVLLNGATVTDDNVCKCDESRKWIVSHGCDCKRTISFGVHLVGL